MWEPSGFVLLLADVFLFCTSTAVDIRFAVVEPLIIRQRGKAAEAHDVVVGCARMEDYTGEEGKGV
jgi:hypothetical protein